MKSARGFTLIELLVVVMIIGILAAIAIPQYSKTVEASHADRAAAVVQMIGTTNRMYALDFPGRFAGMATAEQLTSSCGTTCTNAAAGAVPACNLVSCNYLARQDFGNKYNFYAVNNQASIPAACGTYTAVAGKTWVGCAVRASGGPPISTGWGYAVASDGTMIKTTASGCPDPPKS